MPRTITADTIAFLVVLVLPIVFPAVFLARQMLAPLDRRVQATTRTASDVHLAFRLPER